MKVSKVIDAQESSTQPETTPAKAVTADSEDHTDELNNAVATPTAE